MTMSSMPGDLPAEEFRAAAHRVADLMADYLEGVGQYPVLPKVSPGSIRKSLPATPPEQAEPMDQILDDWKARIEPNLTHWNHPGFMAYFAITGSGPGVLGEALAAAANVNAMLWRTGPAPTELEELVCDWLRQMLGLPETFQGHINDTASSSSMMALAAARHHLPGLEIRRKGLAGRPELGRLTVYASEHAHSSIDKAIIALGIGLDQLRHIPADAQFRMDPLALRQQIAQDRQAGCIPVAVVATIGTTSSTSVDPVAAIADLCAEEKIWLHVDAAYAGSAAICPEMRPLFQGWEQADSIVLNPHKWMFTPVDCSVLLVRDADRLKSAFSLVAEYLKTPEDGVTNLMDFGVQLGRRFRSLKLWMVIRAFGVSGLRDRIRAQCALASELRDWILADPRFEVVAPVPFSTVCFRVKHPTGEAAADDLLNQRILAEVNSAGPVFLSHTALAGRIVLRLTIGNLRTEPGHVATAWQLLQDATTRLLE